MSKEKQKKITKKNVSNAKSWGTLNKNLLSIKKLYILSSLYGIDKSIIMIVLKTFLHRKKMWDVIWYGSHVWRQLYRQTPLPITDFDFEEERHFESKTMR